MINLQWTGFGDKETDMEFTVVNMACRRDDWSHLTHRIILGACNNCRKVVMLTTSDESSVLLTTGDESVVYVWIS